MSVLTIFLSRLLIRLCLSVIVRLFLSLWMGLSSYLILFIIASRPLSTKVNNFLVIYASVQEGKCLWIISNQCFPVLQRVEFFTLISLSVSPAIAVFRAAAPATTNPSQSPLPQLPPKSKTLLNLPNSFN